jgi:type VI secretion system secreted protein Hcp
MISAYLKLEGEVAGAIKGPVRDNRDENKNGSIALIAVDHGIVSPRDAASGLATGKRQHLPITFTKETDGTSPFFYRFVTRNEPIKTAEFFFYGLASQSGLGAGRETMLYQISLQRVAVSKIEFAGHTDATAPDSARFPLTERISLVYDSIKWESTVSKVAAEDTFKSPQT